MVLKLHGTNYSTCTLRVITTLREKGVEYELVPVDIMKGEQKVNGNSFCLEGFVI